MHRVVNNAPESVLYDEHRQQGVRSRDDGHLGGASGSGLSVFQNTFQVKADDGITDLYGVMYKPFDFDAKKKYPIIAFVSSRPADRKRDEDIHTEKRADRACSGRIHRVSRLEIAAATRSDRSGITITAAATYATTGSPIKKARH